MQTATTIVILLVNAICVYFIIEIVMGAAGFPGALIAGDPKRMGTSRFWIAVITSSLGQTYVYLAYVAFMINITAYNVLHGSSALCYVVTFLCIIIPFYDSCMTLRVNNSKNKISNVVIDGMTVSIIPIILAFFVFVADIDFMDKIYWWVPFGK